jgi:hypothetical protein
MAEFTAAGSGAASKEIGSPPPNIAGNRGPAVPPIAESDAQRGRRRRTLWVAGLAGASAVVVVVVVLLAGYGWLSGGTPGPIRPGSVQFQVVDETPFLGAAFHPGVILGAAGNATASLLGGIGVYIKTPEFTLPAVASMTLGPDGPVVTNLTPSLNSYFWEGGIYGAEWNGSAWLVVGQAGWGGGNFGTAVSIEGATITNLTALVYSDFAGGGIFALGWNGTTWLLGGNSSSGPALVSLHGSSVTDLSPQLSGPAMDCYLQVLVWNGADWILGGRGIFETLQGASVTNLMPGTPFQGNGVYAAGWNGSVWLIGGGGGVLALVKGDTVGTGPTMPSTFDQVVLFVAPVPGGWLIGGKGATTAGEIEAEFVYWPSTEPIQPLVDLSSRIPSSFNGGEIQGASPAPMFGPTSYLVVGEGDYNGQSGYGVGAIALLSYTPTS